MEDPTLTDGQYSIDGLVFGRGTTLLVSNTAVDSGAPTTQDTPLVNADGRRFGLDFYPGNTITFSGQALTQPAVGFSTLDSYAAMSAAWTNYRMRRTPGSVQTLRLRYPGSLVTRRVYGRGRRIAPTLGYVTQGWAGFTAQFDAADNAFYSDALQTITLGGVPTLATGGVAPPLTPPVVIASLHESLNLLPPADADFELPWTGAWQPDNLISNLGPDDDESYTGGQSMLAQITAAGMAQWTYSNPLAAVGGTYYSVSAQVWADVGMGGTGKLNILCYDEFDQLIATFASAPFTALSSQWVSISGAINLPPTCVALAPQFQYNAPGSGNVWVDTIVIAGGPQLLWTPNNGGDIDTWPTITFYGPGYNPTLTYPHSGTKIWYNGGLGAREAVTLYTMPWARSLIKTLGVGIDVSGPTRDEIDILAQPLEPPGTVLYADAGNLRGSPLDRLVLVPGLTPAAFDIQDSSGTSRCEISWRNAWSTIGGSLS